MAVLNYYRMFNDVTDIAPATSGSACMDVRAHLTNANRMVKTFTNTNTPLARMVTQETTESPLVLSLAPGERALVPTGIILDIPEGYSVRIHPRSGLAFKNGLGLSNSEGIVDWDYIEQLYVSMINFSTAVVKIAHGDRIAQIEMVPMLAYTTNLITHPPAQKTNRNGGIGSTGVG